MRPVDKLVVHDPENGKYGDCMRACIASLMHLDTIEVPHFYENGPDDYYFKINTFLKNNNLKIIYTSHEGVIFYNDIYHLIFGKNPDGIPHACVAKNGKLVHDPNPSRAGLIDVDSFGFLVYYTDAECKNLNDYEIFTRNEE